MEKRLFDIALASFGLLILSPVIIATAMFIRCREGSPIFFTPKRVGRRGVLFTIYKFRSMRVPGPGSGSAITAHNDSRIFPGGQLLRRLKLDELPQLVNVLTGDMSIVGPRPEDPGIVARAYSEEDRKLLEARPGLISPGSIYNFTHGEISLPEEGTEETYVSKLLRVKLALDAVYVKRASLKYDVALVARALAAIGLAAIGVQNFADPPEMRFIALQSKDSRNSL